MQYIDRTLKATANPGSSGPESNGTTLPKVSEIKPHYHYGLVLHQGQPLGWLSYPKTQVNCATETE